MLVGSRFSAVFLLTVGIFFAQTPSPQNPNLIHLGDLIDVDVVGSFEFDWRGSLSPEGFLDNFDKVPEEIYGLCKSEDDLAAAVAKEYARILRDPQIVVRIIDRSNRAVALLDGAVRYPQRFRLKRQIRLNELLIISGGITERSSGEIRIFRPPGLSCVQKNEAADEIIKVSQAISPHISIIKISDLLSGVETANPLIVSGDTITVLESQPIYLIGGVKAPKPISSRETITLSRAIATAGGLSKDGIAGKITIYGREGRRIQADLNKIKSGQAEDVVLKPYDIVDVGQKGRADRKFPPVAESPNRYSNVTVLPLRIID